MLSNVQVIKMGGNELVDPDWLRRFAVVVAQLPGRQVIVHGGGRIIAEMQDRLGLTPHIVDGLRVTDEPTLDIAQMVMSGRVNKLLVTALLAAGVDAVGLSGVDGGLLRSRKKVHSLVDLGLVGEIVQVRTALLNTLLAAGITPVISPLSLGPDGQPFNVNADEAAAAVATALQVQALIFVSNVPGVMNGAQRPLPVLTPEETGRLIELGTIRGGMVPKTQAAVQVVEAGVPEARIVDLAGLDGRGGTTFRKKMSRREK